MALFGKDALKVLHSFCLIAHAERPPMIGIYFRPFNLPPTNTHYMFIIFKFNVIKKKKFFSACGGSLVVDRCRYIIFEMKQNFIFPFFLYPSNTYTLFYKSLISKNKDNTRSVSINVSILQYHFCKFMTMSKGRMEEGVV